MGVVDFALSFCEPIRERVEVIQGSHADRGVVNRAFEGADAVFWLVPADKKAESVYDAYVRFSIPAVDAIVRYRIGRVVAISALGRGQQRYAGNISASLAMEDLFRSTGVNFRALTMPSFMDNIEWYQEMEQNPDRYRTAALLLQDKLRMLQQRIDQLTEIAPAKKLQKLQAWFHSYIAPATLTDVLTQDEIGQFLGLRRETINRLLRSQSHTEKPSES